MMAKKTATDKNKSPPLLIGYAYDVHNVIKGSGLVLAGVKLDLPLAVQAHSDGDVVLHALSNAILGAIGQGDIGVYFSDSDPKNKNIDSKEILAFCLHKARGQGYCLSNADLQVVSEQVMVARFREQMVKRLVELTGCGRVSVKGTRWEKSSKQIACHAVALLALKA